MQAIMMCILFGVAVAFGGCEGRPFREANMQTGYVITMEELGAPFIPDTVFSLANLRLLSVKGMDCGYGQSPMPCRELYAIPAKIGNLTKLESLSLPVNAISSIPPELGELQNLKAIDLSDNSLLSDIGELKRLKQLGLVGNPIGGAERERIRKALPGCRVLF
jgi:hypothetical protein